MVKILVFLLMFLDFALAHASGLDDAMNQSIAGMKAQGERIKVIAQNIANSSSTGKTPGAEPYRRKLVLFKNKQDKQTGYDVVQVDRIKEDKKTELNKKFDPSHPAANSEGYVLMPNVDAAVESVDIKEAQKSYEANLGAVDVTKRMISSTIDLLK